MGFSQGGLLATAIAVSGDSSLHIKAVVTAGAPCIQEILDTAKTRGVLPEDLERGRKIPKLHFAGQNDAMIPEESVRSLSKAGGNGNVIVHDKGHLFPTKASYVNAMVDFLSEHLLPHQHSSSSGGVDKR